MSYSPEQVEQAFRDVEALRARVQQLEAACILGDAALSVVGNSIFRGNEVLIPDLEMKSRAEKAEAENAALRARVSQAESHSTIAKDRAKAAEAELKKFESAEYRVFIHLGKDIPYSSVPCEHVGTHTKCGTCVALDFEVYEARSAAAQKENAALREQRSEDCDKCGSLHNDWHIATGRLQAAESRAIDLTETLESCEFCDEGAECCKKFDNSYGEMLAPMIVVCTACWNKSFPPVTEREATLTKKLEAMEKELGQVTTFKLEAEQKADAMEVQRDEWREKSAGMREALQKNMDEEYPAHYAAHQTPDLYPRLARALAALSPAADDSRDVPAAPAPDRKENK